jgi:hypothetical protein
VVPATVAGDGTAPLAIPARVLCNNVMRWLPSDPLALSSGAGARLALAALVVASVWAGVAWALLAP